MSIPSILEPARTEGIEFSNDEIARYSRHLIMPEVTLEGQKKLKAAKVLCIGTGGLGSAVEQLEPQRKILANSFHGEPLECVGGVINDLTADARGGVYFSVTGATGSGVFYADPKGVVSQYGKGVPLATLDRRLAEAANREGVSLIG